MSSFLSAPQRPHLVLHLTLGVDFPRHVLCLVLWEEWQCGMAGSSRRQGTRSPSPDGMFQNREFGCGILGAWAFA